MAAFAGPIVAFGCNVTHATYRKLIAWDEFVVNVLPATLAEWSQALPVNSKTAASVGDRPGTVVRRRGSE